MFAQKNLVQQKTMLNILVSTIHCFNKTLRYVSKFPWHVGHSTFGVVRLKANMKRDAWETNNEP